MHKVSCKGPAMRCRAIENTVCTVEKPLRLWRVPTKIADQTCVCVCVSFHSSLDLGQDFHINPRSLKPFCLFLSVFCVTVPVI